MIDIIRCCIGICILLCILACTIYPIYFIFSLIYDIIKIIYGSRKNKVPLFLEIKYDRQNNLLPDKNVDIYGYDTLISLSYLDNIKYEDKYLYTIVDVDAHSDNRYVMVNAVYHKEI